MRIDGARSSDGQGRRLEDSCETREVEEDLSFGSLAVIDSLSALACAVHIGLISDRETSQLAALISRNIHTFQRVHS